MNNNHKELEGKPMPPKAGELFHQPKTSLVDVLDRVVEKGAYVRGEALLNVADIEMIYVSLQLVVSSVSALEEKGTGKIHQPPSAEDLAYIRGLEKQLREIEKSIPQIVATRDPSQAEQGLAKLVLTLVEVIRQLMEREAIRRIEKGNLSDIEIQKLGLSLEAMEKKIKQLKAVFGIKEDLNINLGPLGDLL